MNSEVRIAQSIECVKERQRKLGVLTAASGSLLTVNSLAVPSQWLLLYTFSPTQLSTSLSHQWLSTSHTDQLLIPIDMAAPQTDNALIAALWIPELDGIDPTYLLSPFPAIAQISPKLRALAECCLYSHIQIPFDDIYYNEYLQDIYAGQGLKLWPLIRTLSERPDLSPKVKTLVAIFTYRSIDIDMGSPLFDSGLCVEMYEPALVSDLLQVLSEVTTLSVHLIEENSITAACLSPSAAGSLEKLFSGFNSRAAHLTDLPFMQKVKDLRWYASELHWMLAKLPRLTHLALHRKCEIKPDEAPNETNPSLQELQINHCSSILSGDSTYSQTLAPSLAHFPALKQMVIHISDSSVYSLVTVEQEGIVTASNKGIFAMLFPGLAPVA